MDIVNLDQVSNTTLSYQASPVDRAQPTPHLQVGHPDFVPMPEEPVSRMRHPMPKQAIKGYAPEVAILDDLAPERTQVIILNAPPNCGKDTLMQELSKMHKVNPCSFKNPMFDIALASSGISREDWFARYNNRELKEQPWSRLNGMSCREFMIHISEMFIKPLFGKDHFGTLATNQVREGLNIFTDGGFVEETQTILEEFGQRHVKVIRLHREDCSFEGDSRNYIPDGIAKNTFDVYLTLGEIEEGVLDLEYIINK